VQSTSTPLERRPLARRSGGSEVARDIFRSVKQIGRATVEIPPFGRRRGCVPESAAELLGVDDSA
jgi:hypothetical protein